MTRRRHILVVTGLVAATLGAAAYVAEGAAKVQQPVITSGPANPTNVRTATFAFTDPQTNVTFQCRIDGSDWSTCSSAKSYSGLDGGKHTFGVRALDAQSRISEATNYAWTVDLTPPPAPAIVASSKPANPTNATSATFAFTVPESGVRYQCQLDAAAAFADCTNPQTVAGLGAGTHTFRVRAVDAAGNGSLGGDSYTWVVDLTPPPAPVIADASQPANPTTATSASFAFSDSETGVALFCGLDAATYKACSSPSGYSNLPVGSHTFSVMARDAAGNASPAASYTWTIVSSTASFTISSTPVTGLMPGRTLALPLSITNPNSFAIVVTTLGVTVRPASSKPACSGTANLALRQYAGPPIRVEGRQTLVASTSITTGPAVTMIDASFNQDACKGATFTFDFTGQAQKP